VNSATSDKSSIGQYTQSGVLTGLEVDHVHLHRSRITVKAVPQWKAMKTQLPFQPGLPRYAWQPMTTRQFWYEGTPAAHLVKPDERHEQPDISLCEAVAGQVPVLGQDALHLVQRVEQLPAQPSCLQDDMMDCALLESFGPLETTAW
jgi:hypothetical protein